MLRGTIDFAIHRQGEPDRSEFGSPPVKPEIDLQSHALFLETLQPDYMIASCGFTDVHLQCIWQAIAARIRIRIDQQRLGRSIILETERLTNLLPNQSHGSLSRLTFGTKGRWAGERR